MNQTNQQLLTISDMHTYTYKQTQVNGASKMRVIAYEFEFLETFWLRYCWFVGTSQSDSSSPKQAISLVV